MKKTSDKKTTKKLQSYFSKEKKFSITSEHHRDKALFPENTMMAESFGIQKSNLISQGNKALSNTEIIKRGEHKNG